MCRSSYGTDALGGIVDPATILAMFRASLGALALACVVGGTGGTARAQGSDDAVASANGPDEERALVLFEESVELYRTGRFSDAAALLRTAYSLHAEPVLLYNLARALEGDGDLEGAIDAYARYLETAGDVPDRGAIERKLDTLRREVAEHERLEHAERAPPQRASEAAPPPQGSARRAGPSPLPWVVAGVGAAGMIAGAILGGLALAAHDSALGAPSQRETDTEQRHAQDLAIATDIALIAGGVILAAGVAWGVIDLVGAQGESEARLRLHVLPAMAALEGTFR